MPALFNNTQKIHKQMNTISELNEYCGIDDYDFHPGKFREAAINVAGNTPAIMEAESLCASCPPGVVYSVVKDMAQGFDGIENIPADVIREQVLMETSSYNEDNYDSYDPQAEEDEINAALDYRQRGTDMQFQMDRFLQHMQRKSNVSGLSPAELSLSIIKENPDTIQPLKEYIASRGYQPSNNLVALAAQFLHVLNNDVNEKIDSYQPDNFSFRSEKKKRERQSRRLARIADRIARRKARKQGRLDVRALGDVEDADEQASIQEQAAKEMADMPNTMPEITAGSAGAASDNSSLVTNPSTDEATAEVFGENFGGMPDNFLPFLSSALNLGKDVIGDVSGGRNPITGDNIEQFRDLFRKKGNKKYKGKPGDVIKGNTAKDIVNDTTKKVMDTIEAQKKKDFIRENAPILVVAVLGLVFLGTVIGKK